MAQRRGYTAAKDFRQIGKSQGAKKRDFPKSKLGNVATRYLDYLAMMNYAESSIVAKRKSLNTFLQWAELRDLRTPEQISKPILESYQRHLWRYRKENGNPLGVSTQRNMLILVKNFFAWLTKQNFILANPASELEMPRKEKRLPELALTQEQVLYVLNVPDLKDPLGVRDRAILEVFYSTGIRRKELAELQLTDINAERGCLQVKQGKGKKDRIVPIGKTALYWVARYLDEVRHLLLVNMHETTLFITAHGEGFNPDVLSRMVSKFIKQAEIGRGGSCHLLRHTCATHMLEGGADIRFIQQLLGHEQLSTTAIYTQVSIEQLREVHATTHPAEAKK